MRAATLTSLGGRVNVAPIPMIRRCVLAAALLAALPSPALAQPSQPIYVQYDGFVRNKDGSLTLSFGYFNMNNVDVTVEAGAANAFAPAPADRNQPVTFLKGRHRFVCSMVVDKTFAGPLQWTVLFAGRTQVTTKDVLNPLYELELNSEKKVIAGLDVSAAQKNLCVNRSPAVDLVNPFGAPDATTKLSAKAGVDVPINGHVEDDGLPRGSKLTIVWRKVSGPGDVTFSPASTAATRVKFSAPGDYALELSAADGEKRSTLTVSVSVSQ
jgi:hypothetical protein